MANFFRRAFNFFYYIILMQSLIGITNFLPNIGVSNRIRGFILRPFFGSCGKGFQIARGAIINVPRNIVIGNDVYIAHDVWINGSGGLSIGHNVIVSPKVVIATTRHGYESGSVQLRKSHVGPIKIGDGSWVASNCTITMGVSIGKGCIIGACSCVTKDILDYTLAGGVPAVAIKSLSK